MDFSVNRGDFVFLVGPSGAGKTSVLKLIYGEERPTSGQIHVGQYNLLRMKRREVPYLRRHLGIVFQDFRLLEDRNVFENVAFPLRVTGVRMKEVKKRAMKSLAEVGLSHKRYRMPQELSGGEQQRAAIARALAHEPLVLLADEPTGNLDRDTAKEILMILQRINLRGTAILMATHNFELVKKFSHRIIRIEKGIAGE